MISPRVWEQFFWSSYFPSYHVNASTVVVTTNNHNAGLVRRGRKAGELS